MAKNAHQSPPPRITIRSIAEKAGVSIGAVSSVLNNQSEKRRIPPDTVERIRNAARTLGYLPNIGARQMKGGGGARNTIVLAIITSLQAPLSLVGQFIRALREASLRKGQEPSHTVFTVNIGLFDAGHLSELPGIVTGEHFNAAIITNTTPSDDQFLRKASLLYPSVLVNRTLPGYASVLEDPQTGAMAADLLLSHSRRNLLVLAGNPLTEVTRARIQSFSAAAEAGGAKSVRVLTCHDLSGDSSRAEMTRFLKRGDLIDGLYLVTDGLALGAYQAIKAAGMRIPNDISIIGVGDEDSAPLMDPALTTVGVSPQKLSEAAAEMLMQQIHRLGSPVMSKVIAPTQSSRASF